jgi:hypothetical protein
MIIGKSMVLRRAARLPAGHTPHDDVLHCHAWFEDLWWRDDDAWYIRHRSERYPGATDIEPSWTFEAAADPRRVVYDPDPKSRSGAIRLIGYSPSAGFVLTVIITRRTHAGATAWKSSGADLHDYEGQDSE